MNNKLLKAGKYPGFGRLTSKPGVYWCKLYPELKKAKPEHADYRGILQLTGSKALVLVCTRRRLARSPARKDHSNLKPDVIP
jgi:hypothetical protein